MSKGQSTTHLKTAADLIGSGRSMLDEIGEENYSTTRHNTVYHPMSAKKLQMHKQASSSTHKVNK